MKPTFFIKTLFLLFSFLLITEISCAQKNKIEDLEKEQLFTEYRLLTQKLKKISANQPDELHKVEQRALKIARRLDDSLKVAIVYIRLSSRYYKISDNITCLKYLEKARALENYFQNDRYLSLIYSRLGATLNQTGNYPESIEILLKSLNMSRKLNDTISETTTAINLGVAFDRISQVEKSIYYYQYAYELANKRNDTVRIIQCYNNMAIINRGQENYKKALELYNKSLNLSQLSYDTTNIISVLGNIGILNQHTGDFEKGKEYVLQALDLCKESNNLQSQATWYNTLTEHYLKFKEYKEALKNGLLTIESIDRSERKDVLHLAYNNVSVAYEGLGNYKKALEYQKLHSDLGNEIFNQTNLEEIANLETKHQLQLSNEEKEQLIQENKIQELQLERSQIYMFSLGLGIFLLIIITILFFQRQRLLSVKKTTELESKLFRSQMNPHFIFNSLSAIQSFVYAHEPREAAKYLSSFAKLTRSILTSSAKEFITLDDEIETLEHYIKLQQLRFDNRFQYTIDVDEEIEPSIFEIPPMLIQPFIENSVEHGFSNGLEYDGDLHLNYRFTEKHIEVTLTDNGVGINKSQENKKTLNNSHESMAISIIEERLRLFSSSFVKKRKMISITDLSDLNPEDHGTKVTMLLPYRIR